MVRIDIEIPRPWLTLAIVGGVICAFLLSGGSLQGAVGGTTASMTTVKNAEERVRQLREEQQVIEKREEILRVQVKALEESLLKTHSPATRDALMATRTRLLSLLDSKRKGEQEILSSLRQIWEAQEFAAHASLQDGTLLHSIALEWPAEPQLGISAYFHDESYEQRFGMVHEAIDIPVEQGSIVTAAADGVVVNISDNGMGYSSIVLRHNGGFATLYGHVSGFLVHEGQEVLAGDPIALSGGTPGTPGAGSMTTGAHLHFEVTRGGASVDPLTFLPSVAGVGR